MQNWVIVSSLSIAIIAGAARGVTNGNWYYQGDSNNYIVYDTVQELTNLEYHGNKFSFKKPKLFAVSRSEDGYQVVDDELGVDLFADSLQELQEDLNFILEDNFFNYVSKQDEELASDAKKLKQAMIKLIDFA